MSRAQKVYMMTDMEGVAGVDEWDPRHSDYAHEAKGVYDRSEIQRLLTGEVNAAAEGLFEAGVEDVLINDAHGAGRTILPEELISGVRIARGVQRPSWLLGIAADFDALVQVGMHAKGGTPSACLAHSMSRGVVYRVNGREIGEMGMAACLAGQIGIPWVFTSGDSHACREAEEWVEGMVSAPVKEGLGELCAIHLAPEDARKLIKKRIQEATQKASETAPITIEGPVTMEVQMEEPWPAKIRSGVERVDAFTIRTEGSNFWEVFHHFFYGNPEFPIPA